MTGRAATGHRFANQEMAAARGVAYWEAALRFLQRRPALSDPADFIAYAEYADRAMQVSVPLPERIRAFLGASMFSPLNGWSVYFNNKMTMEADRFLARVTTDATLSRTLPRLPIPLLLIYGARDL